MSEKENTPMATTHFTYDVNRLGNIHSILTGLQGFSSMARELIQNADDAGATKIIFSIENECLRVWNNKPFKRCDLVSDQCSLNEQDHPSDGSEKICDFHAIGSIASRNKFHDSTQIGRFGTGFVSVYQITDTPIIRSAGKQVQLDPVDGQNSVDDIEKQPGSEFELPWASNPNSTVRESLDVPVMTPDNIKTLKSDLISVANECLLFLRNLRSIKITQGGRLIKFVEKRPKRKNPNRVQLSFSPGKRREDWYVIHCSAKTKGAPLKDEFEKIKSLAPQTDVDIAFKLTSNKDWTGLLFAYLPTKQQSPIPCHINADFFPKSDRTAPIFDGASYDQQWNKMLLEVAAEGISEHLLHLREVLGPTKLWELINQAYKNRKEPPFECFWESIKEEAGVCSILWTSAEQWISCDMGNIPQRRITKEEDRALTHISMNLVHSSLRSYRNVLLQLDVQPLSLQLVVNALVKWNQEQFDDDVARDVAAISKVIRPLWTVTNTLIPQYSDWEDEDVESIELLKDVRILPQAKALTSPSEERIIKSINQLYRPQKRKKNKEIHQYIPSIPLVDNQIKKFRKLYNLIDVLTFERLMLELSSRAENEEEAGTLFGTDQKKIKGFYRFLSTYLGQGEEPDVDEAKSSPILASHNGRFLKPIEAILPGDFEDPVGWLNILDTKYYDKRSQKFLRKVFNVQPLNLKAYVRNHLGEILDSDLPDDKYKALLDELITKRKRLSDEESIAILQDLPIIRTQVGELQRPRECYFKNTKITSLLGNQKSLWVDETIFTRANKQNAMRFLKKLGMRDKPALEHVYNRISTITAESPTKRAQNQILNLLDFLSHEFNEYRAEGKEDEFESDVGDLRTSKWLPAIQKSALDTVSWHYPYKVYQPLHSAEYDYFVPVLGASKRGKRTFPPSEMLDFLGMPEVPNASIIVEHFLNCVQRGDSVSDNTYKILSEKMRSEEGRFHIKKLCGVKFIHSPELKKTLAPDRVFWTNPGIDIYCCQAPNWMHKYRDLFGLLGVSDTPNSDTYVGVLIDIAEEFGQISKSLPADVQSVHNKCLDALASDVRGARCDANIIRDNLQDHPFILTIAGILAYPYDTVIRDSEWHAQPFGNKLDGRMIHYTPERSEVLDPFELSSLSSVVRIEAVDNGADDFDDDEATKLLVERRSLLLSLFSGINAEVRQEIANSLKMVKVVRTNKIHARSIFDHSGQPIHSSTKNVEVLYESASNKLFCQTKLGDEYWTLALHAIFSTLIPSSETINVQHCAIIGGNVLTARTYEEALMPLKQVQITPFADIDEDAAEEDSTDVDDEEEVLNGGEQPETFDEGADSRSKRKDKAKTTKARSPSTKKTREKSKRSGSGGTDRKSKRRKKGDRSREWAPISLPPTSGPTAKRPRLTKKQQKENKATDRAAIAGVIRRERHRKCLVERKPQNHPGFDLISVSKETGETRYIEVKGTKGNWTNQGVKLSLTQINNAKEHRDMYWLYVVEHAQDPNNREISPIRNPFSKTDFGFWFGKKWKELAESDDDT